VRADVAVVGGGLAGLAAALRAAAYGARVALVERDPRLGGNATAANVHTLCGLYEDARVGDAVYAHPGLPRAFARCLQAVGAARAPERAGRVWVLPTHPPRLHAVALHLCERTPAIDLRMGTTLRDVSCGTSSYTLRLEGPRGRDLVEARALLDASGDASAAALAGAAVEEPRAGAEQLPSWIFRVGGVETSEIEGFGRLRVTHAVAGAVRAGDLPEACASVLVRPAEASDEVYVTLNLPRFPDLAWAPLDPKSVRAYSERAQGLAAQVLAYLVSSRAAFAKARLRAAPARIGVREARRLSGLVTLERDDILAGRRCDDEVARSSWPIELWEDHRRAHFDYPDGSASIPLGALVSRTQPWLAAAGRCISGSHEALGALRVLGTALATGEAAGVALAMAVDGDLAPAGIAPAEIRDYIPEHAVPALEPYH
jgi:2-polyprenyl-6-methoxyphenol hydroxylase-like FAD-dependent oxidoreductase